ncbi:TPA: hypothetical protein UM684_004575 [Stenotrophomonas maltophilia]|uniref:hypothetical protein n=1 Tax=Stenotrophomonas maltophilia TaxID=40324 RepID=UPI00146476B1|nr:hypothetical protein [Stenotrophomonas maltophilia]MBH1468403.1 hypothetical protein [Stenotrophomonas maltophilia]QJP19303.1 hypothetical protein HKK60_07045 [Stenotrophomonas maltophilia]HEL3824186.1 hypothetical protein [Stenotrophomonas maltophilia]HEL3826424.1 hypothetical protein [Stenotrophomonas maltophilia]HEL3860468.1 hypothetical protein [Stenotrophomonas maltophilia]
MAMCPLAVDWGNVADWAAVAVGVLAAAGTIGVAVLANRTSKRATAIAEEAARIAAQQHQEALDTKSENARILGRMLLNEISTLPMRIGSLRRACNAAVDWNPPMEIGNVSALEFLLRECGHSLFPGAEAVEARIHNLPDSLGADLATLIGGSRTLNDMARRMKERVREPSRNPIGKSFPTTYAGKMADFELLRDHITWLHELSPEFANDFRVFVGLERQDYEEIDGARA